ncbi:hypothetical protein JAAARDRAFT_169472 [Jaapia argillacea MUCL 33604]|uniref:FAD-binding PCMH-type domain-containing protein n=1 Tax=Jaapia argillacea MUCL 33604 TaxID=933084 RepID=A0A067QLM9_9AGAM|nr:hypothetical protein JAAARDRAFT_169472 [Jaapia argillacea MUCL 33604]
MQPFLWLSFFLSPLTYRLGGVTDPKCRCTYGQACWPSSSTFSQLASQLSQPLIYPIPPESACYPSSHPSGNCSAVLQGTRDGNWRSSQSGSMQATNFETFIFDNGTISACYLNTTLGIPCQQGSVPVIGVDARTVQDVQAGVKFAAEHNLRLVVKNTGHDFLGRSTARGSFLLWTHNMKNISFNDTFTPTGAPASEQYNAITLEAGVQWHEAYSAAEANGRLIIGGVSIGGSVGAAGGWVLGGGHSALSPAYGLGVDNVLQFTIVTSDGQHLVANANSHPDLFWALRGGGGGTFGVVTSVTYRTYPSAPVIGVFFVANTADNATLRSLYTDYVRTTPALADAGWGGYGYFQPNGLSFAYINPKLSWGQANTSLDTFMNSAMNLTGYGLDIQAALTVPFPSVYSWFSTIFAAGVEQVGSNIEIGSRLLPRDVVVNDVEKVVDTIMSPTLTSMNPSWLLVAGGNVSKVDPDSTGLNPAWRDAIVHFAMGVGWPDGTLATEIQALRGRVSQALVALNDLAPNSGAYLNEASLYEQNWQYTFFGSHYEKLKSIKHLYDPKSLFVVASGVGSEEWDDTLNCRK